MPLEFMNGTGVEAKHKTEAREIEDAVWSAVEDDASDITWARTTRTQNDDGTFTVAVNTRFATNDRDAFETELRDLHTAVDAALDADVGNRFRRAQTA